MPSTVLTTVFSIYDRQSPLHGPVYLPEHLRHAESSYWCQQLQWNVESAGLTGSIAQYDLAGPELKAQEQESATTLFSSSTAWHGIGRPLKLTTIPFGSFNSRPRGHHPSLPLDLMMCMICSYRFASRLPTSAHQRSPALLSQSPFRHWTRQNPTGIKHNVNSPSAKST